MARQSRRNPEDRRMEEKSNSRINRTSLRVAGYPGVGRTKNKENMVRVERKVPMPIMYAAMPWVRVLRSEVMNLPGNVGRTRKLKRVLRGELDVSTLASDDEIVIAADIPEMNPHQKGLPAISYELVEYYWKTKDILFLLNHFEPFTYIPAEARSLSELQIEQGKIPVSKESCVRAVDKALTRMGEANLSVARVREIVAFESNLNKMRGN